MFIVDVDIYCLLFYDRCSLWRFVKWLTIRKWECLFLLESDKRYVSVFVLKLEKYYIVNMFFIYYIRDIII